MISEACIMNLQDFLAVAFIQLVFLRQLKRIRFRLSLFPWPFPRT